MSQNIWDSMDEVPDGIVVRSNTGYHLRVGDLQFFTCAPDGVGGWIDATGHVWSSAARPFRRMAASDPFFSALGL